jgi:uncharacterized protein
MTDPGESLEPFEDESSNQSLRPDNNDRRDQSDAAGRSDAPGRSDVPGPSHRSDDEIDRDQNGAADQEGVQEANHDRVDSPTRVGPGIPESVLWTIGVLVVHGIGAVVTLIGITIWMFVSTGVEPGAVPDAQKLAKTLFAEHAMLLMAGEMAFFVFVVVIASLLRTGRPIRRRLGLTAIPFSHLVLICAVTIPLSMLCGGLHQILTGVWESLTEGVPFFDRLSGIDINEQLKPMTEGVPIAVLFLLIAVAPAIGEEIVFRGVIGRGLVARHGIVAGVTLTSLAFAAVHLHPAHVVSLLPLAFFIHLVYLTTRSFLAPMLLHLLNNSLAVVVLKLSGLLEKSALAGDEAMPPYLLVVLAGVVAIVAVTLWKSRVEYLRPDGSLWDPGYPTIEAPPHSVSAMPILRPCPLPLVMTSLGLAGGMTLIFVLSVGAAILGPDLIPGPEVIPAK